VALHKFVTYLDIYPLTYSPGTHMGLMQQKGHSVRKLTIIIRKDCFSREQRPTYTVNHKKRGSLFLTITLA